MKESEVFYGILPVLQYRCGIAAAIVALVGIIRYIVAVTEQKGAAPSKGSWFVWSLFDTITCIGMYMAHTMNFQIVAVAAGNWITLGFVLYYGKSGLTTLEKVCVGIALSGVALGYAINDPVVTVLITLSAVFIGSWPTLESGLFSPWKEDQTAWILFAASSFLATLAIPAWTLGDAAQPFVFLLISGSMVFLTTRPYAKPADSPAE